MTDEKVIELANGVFYLHHPAEDAEILAFAQLVRNETLAELAVEPVAELVDYILQDDIHNRLTPRVVDIAYSAFVLGRSGTNSDDGGPCDWFNDTKPMVMEQIAKVKKDLAEEAAPVRKPSPPPPAEPVVKDCLTTEPAAEHVATVRSWTNGSYWRNYKLEWHKDVPEGTKLYASPPADRPLTDDAIAEAVKTIWGCASIAPRQAPEFARAIEQLIKGAGK